MTADLEIFFPTTTANRGTLDAGEVKKVQFPNRNRAERRKHRSKNALVNRNIFLIMLGSKKVRERER